MDTRREEFLDESRRKLLQLRRELGARSKETVAIDRTLEKLRSGEYGRCEDCQGEISPARLEVMPTARFCKSCARALEEPESSRESAAAAPPVAGDYEGMNDEELRSAILEELRTSGEGFEAVEVMVESGNVKLAGVVPTEQHRDLVLETIRDRIGVEPTHRLRVDRLAFETAHAARQTQPAADEPEVQRALEVEENTENVFDAEEKGIGFTAPDRPAPPPRKP